VLIAELIREAALEGVRDELPHSLAVVVDEMGPGDDPDVLLVHATVHVERQSQKPIVLGPHGTRLRDVGTAARHEIETRLGRRVYLELHVSVLKDWQRDPKQLRRLGF
jgi:GTP-binding protein Era